MTTDNITISRALLEQLVGALETGIDLARNHAEDVHESYKGYYPERHAAVDRDVVDIAEAITAGRAALANAKPDPLFVKGALTGLVNDQIRDMWSTKPSLKDAL